MPDTPLKILFAASEAQPFIKTGGLADVAAGLPAALRELGHDVRLILPGYPQVMDKAIPLKTVAEMELPPGRSAARLLFSTSAKPCPLYLIDAPDLFARIGNPYTDPRGQDWSDNAERFTLFCRAITAVASTQADPAWSPDVVHCNDWQTGLVPALLTDVWNRPATLFTIHNLAYQGVYSRQQFDALQLPEALWSMHGVEFHDNFSFIKSGIAFSDWVTTVSPGYADEVLTPAFGYGLEGALNHRAERFTGILNGVDYEHWDPGHDPFIEQQYRVETFNHKALNKPAVQKAFGLAEREDCMLLGYIGRLVEQKGVDLILDILPALSAHRSVQLVMLGSGDSRLESALQDAASQYPDQIGVVIGYDERLAHLVEAGCDSFIMPSRFEPCGLNQLYSLRYGTVPIVHRTGGLGDTIVNTSSHTMLDGTATGFVFDHATPDSLLQTVERAIGFYRRPGIWWQKLATAGMKQNFSWDASARRYLNIYQAAMEEPAPNPVV